MSIVELAEVEANKAKANSITELVLDIGTMSGIEFFALDAAMEMAIKKSMLESSQITINKIQARAKCTECKTTFDIDKVYDPCPQCNSLYHEILGGKELQIKSLVVDVAD